MKNKINEEIKTAMKARDKFRLDALRYIKSKIEDKDFHSPNKSDLDAVIEHHKTMVKLQVHFAGDRLATLGKELRIIEEFMPKSLTQEEYEVLVDKHIALDNMGQIMSAVKAEVEGSFNGKLVSSLIKGKLT